MIPDGVVAQRPHLRGRLHQLAFLASLVGLIWLVRAAPTGRAAIAGWIYGTTAALLYFTSSSYHVFARSPQARRIMQRADHSMIFILIAGTFTPICILALTGPWRWALLVAVWAGALAGVLLALTALDRFRKLVFALYLVLGWGALVCAPALFRRPGLFVLVCLAGLLYTVGAVLFALNWPRLSPRWFGYHEVWHTFVVAAGVLLFMANLSLVSAG